MRRATRAWVRKAEDDQQAAARLAAGSEPLPDQVCFFCQQSAEKYLKALVEEVGLTVPKTHDLVELLALLAPHHPALRSYRRGLTFLTTFAVAARYPGYNAKGRQAAAALQWAGKVRDTCRTLLGVRPPKQRKSR